MHCRWLAVVVGVLTIWSVSAEYGFVFFRGNGEDGVYLARSQDGYHWAERSGETILKGIVGGGLTRDPSVLYGQDGLYHMVWTTDWNTNGFGLAHSHDLQTWSRQEFVPVMDTIPDVANVWAPEIFFDKATCRYVVIWASTVGEPAREGKRDHRQWCATTKDFKSWSEPKEFFNPGFNVIDAFPLLLKDCPLFVVKDERLGRKCLFVAHLSGSSVLSPCERIDEPFTRTEDGWAEGPTALALADGTWVVYFDEYRKRQYGAVTTRDFMTFTRCHDIVLPKGIRHGTTFSIASQSGANREQLLKQPQ